MARKGRAKALPPKMLTVYGDIVQETEDAKAVIRQNVLLRPLHKSGYDILFCCCGDF